MALFSRTPSFDEPYNVGLFHDFTTTKCVTQSIYYYNLRRRKYDTYISICAKKAQHDDDENHDGNGVFSDSHLG